MVFVTALAMLDAERGADDANITNFCDAMWWGSTTITTVGCGDRFPVTGEGRLVAVALMLTGIALLGVITAALASWFVERIGAVEAAKRALSRIWRVFSPKLDALREDVRGLTARRSTRSPLLGVPGHLRGRSGRRGDATARLAAYVRWHIGDGVTLLRWVDSIDVRPV